MPRFLHSPRPASTRRVSGMVLGLAIAVLLGVLVGATTGAVEGLGTFLAACVLIAIFDRVLPTRPLLDVSLVGSDGPLAGPTVWSLPVRALPSFDVDTVLQGQLDDARRGVPPELLRPPPKGGVSAIHELTRSPFEPSRRDVERFVNALETYRQELQAWLEAAKAARFEQWREFSLRLRVVEAGRASASHVVLRLRFGSGFDEPVSDPGVELPPRRPDFSDNGVLGSPGRYLDLPSLVPIPLTGPSSIAFVREGDELVAQLSIARVNQGDYVEVPLIRLRRPPDGSHEIQWEITAGELNGPVGGRLAVLSREPEPEEALATLDAVKDNLAGWDLL